MGGRPRAAIPALDLAGILDRLSDATSLVRVVHSSLAGKETAGDELSALRNAYAMLDEIYAVMDRASDLLPAGEVPP